MVIQILYLTIQCFNENKSTKRLSRRYGWWFSCSMNSHKEWSDARVGNSSQNVEANESLNFKAKLINFKCLYLRCYSDLSEQMKVSENSFVLLSMCTIRYGIGMLQLQIFALTKLKISRNPLKMCNLRKFKTVQKVPRSDSETSYKLIELTKTISS